MRKTIFIIVLLLSAFLVKAKSNDAVKRQAADTVVFSTVEHEPEFPGGMKKFHKYLVKHLHYPDILAYTNVPGKVLIQFIVEKDGSVTHAKIVKSLEENLDKEALRVLSNSPKWKPGTQNGYKVRTYYTVPINFTITNG
jgi:protein TonB